MALWRLDESQFCEKSTSLPIDAVDPYGRTLPFWRAVILPVEAAPLVTPVVPEGVAPLLPIKATAPAPLEVSLAPLPSTTHPEVLQPSLPLPEKLQPIK